ncbi:MAG: enolase C-terminal domain-like protein [Salinivirgaceae bacterium]
MLKASIHPYTFVFNFPGGTSRGVLTEKPSWFIKLWNDTEPEVYGLGEVSIIPDLSPENPLALAKKLDEVALQPEIYIQKHNLLEGFPALRFGLETAWLDLQNGGNRILFPSDFTLGKQGIRINGLIWMADKTQMMQRIQEKMEQGFTCIKIKVGAIEFKQELELLKFIRQQFDARSLEIRVDANGAFTPENAMDKLEQLSKFQLHSIEQPIKQGQWENMHRLCRNSPIPIALDEELIGIEDKQQRIHLLESILPQYIILKPSLIGGLYDAKEWSQLAKERNIAWWLTSALEGNIGLNALAQWTFINGSAMPQGLGTGQVYANNINAPLEIQGERLWYNPEKSWQNFETFIENSNTEPKDSLPAWKQAINWRQQKITLNYQNYLLHQTDWQKVKNSNPSAWWQRIVEFLENWADDSPTLKIKTSGSTGKPKTIDVKKAHLWVSAKKTCEFFKLHANSTGLLCLSADYIAGQMMLVRALFSGMNLLCLEPAGNPVKNLETTIDFCAMVPLQVKQSLETPEKFKLIKQLIIGGGPVNSLLVNQLKTFPVKVFETFGMTETLSHIALRQVTPPTEKAFTCLSGIRLSVSEKNCLQVSYPEMEINTMETNDVVEIHSENSFTWLGRLDFVINSGGIKIHPESVEKLLESIVHHPFCIVGKPDEKLGEKTVLVIESERFDTANLMKQMKQMLPLYQCPKEIFFIASFPRSESGKIKRAALKSLLKQICQ